MSAGPESLCGELRAADKYLAKNAIKTLLYESITLFEEQISSEPFDFVEGADLTGCRMRGEEEGGYVRH